jgi:hypothetical protein
MQSIFLLFSALCVFSISRFSSFVLMYFLFVVLVDVRRVKAFKLWRTGNFMEVKTINVDERLNKIARDVELIKNILVSEGELSDWAEEEIDRARSNPELEYVSLADAKKRIINKK